MDTGADGIGFDDEVGAGGRRESGAVILEAEGAGDVCCERGVRNFVSAGVFASTQAQAAFQSLAQSSAIVAGKFSGCRGENHQRAVESAVGRGCRIAPGNG